MCVYVHKHVFSSKKGAGHPTAWHYTYTHTHTHIYIYIYIHTCTKVKHTDLFMSHGIIPTYFYIHTHKAY